MAKRFFKALKIEESTLIDLPTEQQNIYYTLRDWVVYAQRVEHDIFPPHLYYNVLKKWCEGDWCKDFNGSLRALVNIGLVVIGGANRQNPQLKLNEEIETELKTAKL